jgi:plastocyanin
MIAIRHQGDDTMRTTFTRAAVAAGLLGCAIGITVGVAFAGAGDAALKIDDFSFTPKSMTVKAGTTVTWTNQDDIPHTVTSTTKQFRSNALDTDDKFTFTFSTPGTYDYFCSLHPKMTGTIVVAAATGASAQGTVFSMKEQIRNGKPVFEVMTAQGSTAKTTYYDLATGEPSGS